ncbi:MAG TPA: hypothetical protein VF144_19510 [Chitinophagaceae bacterium]
MEDLFYQSVIPLSCKRLLHPDVEEFMIEQAERLASNSDINIMIQVSEEQPFNVDEITSIIHQHFEGKIGQAKHQIKTTISLGLKSLVIAFLFLIITYLLIETLKSFLSENALLITLREFFIILGWVALWRPADLLLYEWRPHQRKAKLFARIARSKVQVTR